MNEPSDGRHHRLMLELLAACEARDESAVRSLFHPDATVLVDRGDTVDAAGTVDAVGAPVRGALLAARRLVRLFEDVPRAFAFEHPVNGRTGLVVTDAGRVVGVLSAEVDGDGPSITVVLIVLSPHKLRGWNVH